MSSRKRGSGVRDIALDTMAVTESAPFTTPCAKRLCHEDQ
jgi:hypothetical protein